METAEREGLVRAKKRKADRRRRLRRLRAALYAVLFLWGILGLIGIVTVAQYVLSAAAKTQERVYGRSDMTQTQTAWTKTADEQETQERPEGGAEGESGGEGVKIRLTEEERRACAHLYRKNPELLVIANKERELPPDYEPQLRYICSGRLLAADVMYSDLTAMLHAAGDAGFDYWIASGYRSRQRQQELVDEDVQAFMEDGMSYEAALAKTLEETMPAGRSEHETGLSLDILCSGNTEMDASQADEPGNRWLVENCARFGFILRYPADKEEITGIFCEPWHFRYVGKEAAQLMTELGLTLEEFVGIAENGV